MLLCCTDDVSWALQSAQARNIGPDMHRQSVTGDPLKNVTESFKSKWSAMSSKCKEFSNKFTRQTNARWTGKDQQDTSEADTSSSAAWRYHCLCCSNKPHLLQLLLVTAAWLLLVSSCLKSWGAACLNLCHTLAGCLYIHNAVLQCAGFLFYACCYCIVLCQVQWLAGASSLCGCCHVSHAVNACKSCF